MLQNLLRHPRNTHLSLGITRRVSQSAAHPCTAERTSSMSSFTNVALADLPKSNHFTASLPADPHFPTPSDSFKATRNDLGPRKVRGALYTYVKPEKMENPELLAVSSNALRDLGLKVGEEETQEFKDLMAGNKIDWNEETRTGIYPWAQCYGGT